jgi:RimJ/RimL family protein N-acetyltransferase
VTHRLVTLSNAHIDTLMQWFPDAASVAVWSPSNSFPFTDRQRFILESKLDEIASWMLVDDADTPLAFGQYYARQGCCHLGRLVVAPQRRGEGLGGELIRRLMARGTEELGMTRCSLFVLDRNTVARKVYASLGFVETEYPEKMPLADCRYLTLQYKVSVPA